MPSYVGAIDQGTTSSRFLIFDEIGKIVAIHQIEFPQHYPHPGWIEHDPNDLLNSVSTCIDEAINQFLKDNTHSIKDLKAIGITNQRETFLVWDKNTGKPLHNAIVWCDVRTIDLVHHLTKQHGDDIFRKSCGLPISTYFSAMKLLWMIKNVPAVKDAHDNDTLLVGTVDTWLIWNLTGGINGGLHITDVTNASRTMFMDINTLEWNQQILDFFNVKKSCLPRICSSSEIYGHIKIRDNEIPIAGILGDQQAAFVGQKCFKSGEAKNTYGTGCFMLFNTGTTPFFSKSGLITTVGYKFGNTPTVYALEGSIAVAGSAIKWLRDNLGIINETKDVNTLAALTPDTGGVYFVTAFSGLYAPYWRDDARGCIVGITQYTRKEHIARATLEATCFQTRAILEAMNNDSGHPLTYLKVDGGMTSSDICMQIQADILGMEVDRPMMRETTALGAAMAAGLAVGVWKSLSDLYNVSSEDNDVFKPQISSNDALQRYQLWQKAVERSFGWA
ncbi:10807_t:CDS:2 [Dentiscutata erythropus]|uniref:glycerol kinase n=1 Tax=Dentiscutata erythropus TaxID=1348616 RepID=A0A9N9BLF6_9GLOM|nr:10807_t:CDS:2 [Dentiscutata erythropus]